MAIGGGRSIFRAGAEIWFRQGYYRVRCRNAYKVGESWLEVPAVAGEKATIAWFVLPRLVGSPVRAPAEQGSSPAPLLHPPCPRRSTKRQLLSLGVVLRLGIAGGRERGHNAGSPSTSHVLSITHVTLSKISGCTDISRGWQGHADGWRQPCPGYSPATAFPSETQCLGSSSSLQDRLQL